MRLVCTCHGVSGACNVQTCRYSLPEFYTVGDFLQQKYHGAIYVTFDQGKNRLIPKDSVVPPHTADDLVYLENSPDYCIKNLKEGTLGVAGRRCNKTSNGPDGCDIMCCGMGFHTKKVSDLKGKCVLPLINVNCLTVACMQIVPIKKVTNHCWMWSDKPSCV